VLQGNNLVHLCEICVVLSPELRQVWDNLVTSIGDSDTETGLNSLQKAYGL